MEGSSESNSSSFCASFQLERLNAYYYPLEIDPNLSNAEKLPLMTEWWSKAHDILVQAGLRRDAVRRSVYSSGITLK